MLAGSSLAISCGVLDRNVLILSCYNCGVPQKTLIKNSVSTSYFSTLSPFIHDLFIVTLLNKLSKSLSSSFICVCYENKMPCVEIASLFLPTCDPVSATKPSVTFLLNFVKTGMSSMNVSSVTVILFVGTENEFLCICYFATSLGKVHYRTFACNTIGVLQVL